VWVHPVDFRVEALVEGLVRFKWVGGLVDFCRSVQFRDWSASSFCRVDCSVTVAAAASCCSNSDAPGNDGVGADAAAALGVLRTMAVGS
jgi:hypothetical protein